MPSALLWASSAEKLFYISRLSRPAGRDKRIFTVGAVSGGNFFREKSGSETPAGVSEPQIINYLPLHKTCAARRFSILRR